MFLLSALENFAQKTRCFSLVIRRLEEAQGVWYGSALVFRNREQMNFVQRSVVFFILVFTLLDVVFMFPCCDEVLSPESSGAVLSASNSEPHSSDLASDNCLCCARIVLTREFTPASSGCTRMAADARGIILLPAPPETHFHPPRPA
jgi:hypothetical protein